jgi:hypothetical protein
LRLERRTDGRSGVLYVCRRRAPLDIDRKKLRVGEFEVEMWSDETRFFALMFDLPHTTRHGESLCPC